MKIEKVLLYLNYAFFLRVAKGFGKNLKQNIFIVFLLKLVLSIASVTKMPKASLALGLGKSIFVRTILPDMMQFFYPRICTEYIDGPGISLFYVNNVYIV